MPNQNNMEKINPNPKLESESADNNPAEYKPVSTDVSGQSFSERYEPKDAIGYQPVINTRAEYGAANYEPSGNGSQSQSENPTVINLRNQLNNLADKLPKADNNLLPKKSELELSARLSAKIVELAQENSGSIDLASDGNQRLNQLIETLPSDKVNEILKFYGISRTNQDQALNWDASAMSEELGRDSVELLNKLNNHATYLNTTLKNVALKTASLTQASTEESPPTRPSEFQPAEDPGEKFFRNDSFFKPAKDPGEQFFRNAPASENPPAKQVTSEAQALESTPIPQPEIADENHKKLNQAELNFNDAKAEAEFYLPKINNETQAIWKDLELAEKELAQLETARHRKYDPNLVLRVNELREKYAKAAVNQANSLSIISPEAKIALKSRLDNDLAFLFTDNAVYSPEQKQTKLSEILSSSNLMYDQNTDSLTSVAHSLHQSLTESSQPFLQKSPDSKPGPDLEQQKLNHARKLIDTEPQIALSMVTNLYQTHPEYSHEIAEILGQLSVSGKIQTDELNNYITEKIHAKLGVESIAGQTNMHEWVLRPLTTDKTTPEPSPPPPVSPNAVPIQKPTDEETFNMDGILPRPLQEQKIQQFDLGFDPTLTDEDVQNINKQLSANPEPEPKGDHQRLDELNHTFQDLENEIKNQTPEQGSAMLRTILEYNEPDQEIRNLRFNYAQILSKKHGLDFFKDESQIAVPDNLPWKIASSVQTPPASPEPPTQTLNSTEPNNIVLPPVEIETPDHDNIIKVSKENPANPAQLVSDKLIGKNNELRKVAFDLSEGRSSDPQKLTELLNLHEAYTQAIKELPNINPALQKYATEADKYRNALEAFIIAKKSNRLDDQVTSGLELRRQDLITIEQELSKPQLSPENITLFTKQPEFESQIASLVEKYTENPAGLVHELNKLSNQLSHASNSLDFDKLLRFTKQHELLIEASQQIQNLANSPEFSTTRQSHVEAKQPAALILVLRDLDTKITQAIADNNLTELQKHAQAHNQYFARLRSHPFFSQTQNNKLNEFIAANNNLGIFINKVISDQIPLAEVNKEKPRLRFRSPQTQHSTDLKIYQSTKKYFSKL